MAAMVPILTLALTPLPVLVPIIIVVLAGMSFPLPATIFEYRSCVFVLTLIEFTGTSRTGECPLQPRRLGIRQHGSGSKEK
ncbi:MAG: hypothetical protein HYY29_02950 [Chloroflexi bacterium]|nr:hypothetical protein [Chloroflexota bacterium]